MRDWVERCPAVKEKKYKSGEIPELGDLVCRKHKDEVRETYGVAAGFGNDKDEFQNKPPIKESYALVRWLTGTVTKVYEKIGRDHVLVIALAQEEK